MTDAGRNLGLVSDWADTVPDGLIAMRAEVWQCGDEWCDCSQAKIQGANRRSPHGQPWFDLVLWEGTFRTGWPYEYDQAMQAEGGPTTELNREARRLRKRHNALYHRIEWPWDRTRRVDEERQREEEQVIERERLAAEREQHAADAAERAAVARDLFVASVRDFLGGER